MSQPTPLTVSTIVDRIGLTPLARALGHKHVSTVHGWKTRGRIPIDHWEAVLRVAQEKNIDGIDLSTLAQANGIGCAA